MISLNQLKEILTKYDFIEFALLFGSFANGKSGFLSDVDIAIHITNDIDIFTQGKIISDLEEGLYKKVDLIIINDLYKNNAKLAFNIIDNHKVIFCKKQDVYVDFKTNTLKYYFDMSYMYEMFDNALKRRIENGTFGKTKAS